jgi:diguanylate cyclase
MTDWATHANSSPIALDELYATVPAMMHSIGPDGRLVQVSDTWLAILGFERHEVIGELSSLFLTEESRRYAKEVVLPEFFRSGRCDDVEYQMVCKDGRVIDVLLSATLRRDESGNPLCSIAVIRDITDKKMLDRALIESERQYKALFQHVQAGFALLELPDSETKGDGLRFVAINPAFAHLCGVAESTVFELRAEKVLANIDLDVPQCRAVLRDVALTGMAREMFDVQGSKNRWFDLVSYSPQSRQCALLVQETTQRKHLQRTLKEQHEQLRVTLRSIGDAVISTDREGRIQYLNPVAERLTGWSLKVAQGRFIEEVFQIFYEGTNTRARNPVEGCLKEGRAIKLDDGIELISSEGTHFSIEDSAAPITSSAGAILGVVLVFRDVTEQRRVASEVMFRATHDTLTGLMNRSEFEAVLERELERARVSSKAAAVLYVDLDQFKLVNDTCGHAAGDELLKQVSKCLDECISDPHTLARLGGDEFGIILPDCSIRQARDMALFLCKAVDDLRFEYEGHSFGVGASIGVVPLDSRWRSTSSVMQSADSACYAAKDAGRNRIHVWSDTDKIVLARKDEMHWVRRLRQALDENRFVLFAQEIVALQTPGERLRFEVLLRLCEEDGQIISPAAFLPAAERFNIINRIDRWVVSQVFQWMSQHPGKFDHVECVSVNLSGQSISDSAFHEYIAELLRSLQIDATKLCFEVTETAAVTNLEAARDFVYTLRQFGARFALDDFGSGASSFGYLKALPVDYLKIDGQFVVNLARDELDRTVVKCIQEVASVLGKEAIAEFVETEEVARLLKDMGVGGAQGFFLHQPQPLDEILMRRPFEFR